jgi:hypothetical protein
MPVTRLITAEEDIAMSISTTVRGLVAKYNTSAPGQQPAVDAKALLISIVANTCLGVNDLIEACPITFTEKSSLRGDMKTIVGKAFRAKLGVVGASGEVLDATDTDKK